MTRIARITIVLGVVATWLNAQLGPTGSATIMLALWVASVLGAYLVALGVDEVIWRYEERRLCE